jgi:hypothetical protein
MVKPAGTVPGLNAEAVAGSFKAGGIKGVGLTGSLISTQVSAHMFACKHKPSVGDTHQNSVVMATAGRRAPATAQDGTSDMRVAMCQVLISQVRGVLMRRGTPAGTPAGLPWCLSANDSALQGRVSGAYLKVFVTKRLASQSHQLPRFPSTSVHCIQQAMHPVLPGTA